MPRLNVAMIGYGFRGAAHPKAWRVASRFFDSPLEPRMHTIVGRHTGRTAAAAQKFGWAHVETDWRRVVDNPDIDLIDIGPVRGATDRRRAGHLRGHAFRHRPQERLPHRNQRIPRSAGLRPRAHERARFLRRDRLSRPAWLSPHSGDRAGACVPVSLVANRPHHRLRAPVLSPGSRSGVRHCGACAPNRRSPTASRCNVCSTRSRTAPKKAAPGPLPPNRQG